MKLSFNHKGESEMKIDILGYCGGYPWGGGATAGYLVKTEEGEVLLDCGSGVVSKLSAKTDIKNLSGLILSHLHHDHIADVGVLNYAVFGASRVGKRTTPLNIYAPDEPKNMLEYIQGQSSEVHMIDEHINPSIANIDISFLEVKHTIPCYAVKMEYQGKVFVYSADTEYTEELIEFARGADLFICEATNCEGSDHTVGKGHMDAEEAGNIARKANVKELVLTHLPYDGDYQMMKELASTVFGKEVHLANEKSSYIL